MKVNEVERQFRLMQLQNETIKSGFSSVAGVLGPSFPDPMESSSEKPVRERIERLMEIADEALALKHPNAPNLVEPGAPGWQTFPHQVAASAYEQGWRAAEVAMEEDLGLECAKWAEKNFTIVGDKDGVNRARIAAARFADLHTRGLQTEISTILNAAESARANAAADPKNVAKAEDSIDLSIQLAEAYLRASDTYAAKKHFNVARDTILDLTGLDYPPDGEDFLSEVRGFLQEATRNRDATTPADLLQSGAWTIKTRAFWKRIYDGFSQVEPSKTDYYQNLIRKHKLFL